MEDILEIYRQIQIVRRRIRWLRLIEGFWYGLFAGIITANLWFVAGRLWPIHHLWIYASVSFGTLLLSGCIWGYSRKIVDIDAARMMDIVDDGEEQLDIMTTALSFSKSESLPAQIQRGQAVQYGEAYVLELKKKLPNPRKRKWWLAVMAGVLMLTLLVILPSPMEEVLAQQNIQREWANKQKQETDQRIKELEMYKLDPIKKDSISQELLDLQRSLQDSTKPEEMLSDVEMAMKKMKEMSDKLNLKEHERETWLEQWKNNPVTEGLSEKLRQRNSEQLTKEMDSLRNELSTMSEQQKKQLAEQLQKLAELAPQGNEDAQKLAESLKQAAEAIGKGIQKEEIEQALKKLEEALKQNIEASSSQSQQSEAAAAMAAALAKQGIELAENMAASGLAVSDTWSMGGAAEQLASSDNMGSGSSSTDGESGSDPSGSGSNGQGSNGVGQSGGNGQGGQGGNGQGNGQGSGVGTGTGTGAGTGQGAGLGSGGRTLVTSPRDLKGSGNVQQDGGPATGGNVQKGGRSPVYDGVSRPYEEVYSDYATEAKRSLDRSELPQSMQSLVENYFVEIDPGR